MRAVMAEWTFRDAENGQRVRFDAAPDASLETCLTREVAELKHAPAPGTTSAASRPPAKRSSSRGWFVGVVIAIGVLVAAFVLGGR